MSQRAFSYATGVAFTAAGATCWSFGGALVRLTEHVDVWQIIFFRSLALLICIGIWLGFRFRASLFNRIAGAGFNAVIAGVAAGTAGITFVAAMFYTTIAEAVFMVGIAPFLSAILGFWILRERISPITWAAMLIALIGMGLIFYGGSGGGAFTGTMLAIYSAFCFSCYAVLLRWGQKTEMAVALIWNAIFLIAITAAVLLLPTGLRSTIGPESFLVGWWNLGVIAIMGAIQLALGFILFTIGSRRIPAAQLSLIALVEPTLSPLWAWLAANELPPIWTFAGGAVIVLAIMLQALFSASRDHYNARRQNRRQPAFDHP